MLSNIKIVVMTNSIVSINLKSKSHSESTSPGALYKTEQEFSCLLKVAVSKVTKVTSICIALYHELISKVLRYGP